ncbi:MAG: hypothetical protein AAF481_11275 [Acidobacteriota bacterium]
MNSELDNASVLGFCVVVIGSFLAAYLGRKHSNESAERNLSEQGLNRWLIGLSAGATANSGFVVTGAVGLGYSQGVYWLLLPLGWFVGDLLFWHSFPHRINDFGRAAKASTLSDLISHQLGISRLHPLVVVTTLLVLLCLGGYTLAQWVAGQKFLEGAFGASNTISLLVFAALIIAYTTIGRFRGSVYADSFQAITRLAGTAIALVTVSWAAFSKPDIFSLNITSAGSGFLSILGTGSLTTAIGVVVGYAAASLGFGLGQPQVTSRYLAGQSPAETRAARWIYILYVQSTWATMTIFGVILRGVSPDIPDPEKGLTIFLVSALPPLLAGIIIGDIFGAIASTANSLLVAMAQAARGLLGPRLSLKVPFSALTMGFGIVTVFLSSQLGSNASVFEIAISSVSLMAAGLAPVVAIKVLRWPHSTSSVSLSIALGLSSAILWKISGLSENLNEAAIGFSVGLLTNYLFSPSNSPAKRRREV